MLAARSNSLSHSLSHSLSRMLSLSLSRSLSLSLSRALSLSHSLSLALSPSLQKNVFTETQRCFGFAAHGVLCNNCLSVTGSRTVSHSSPSSGERQDGGDRRHRVRARLAGCAAPVKCILVSHVAQVCFSWFDECHFCGSQSPQSMCTPQEKRLSHFI